MCVYIYIYTYTSFKCKFIVVSLRGGIYTNFSGVGVRVVQKLSI